MTAFWILCALAAALAAWAVLFASRHALTPSSGAIEVGRAELDELDRLRDRGLIEPQAWAEARAEAGRRLLADTRVDTGDGPATAVGSRGDRLGVLVGAGCAVLAAAALYALIGRPGYADQPYQRRVDQWAQSTGPLEAAQVAAVLTREARLRPNEPQVLQMLGAARFQAGDAVGAVSAFRKSLAVQPNDARSWARLGESLVRSQDGVVGADAEAAFREAVRIDPDQLGALYFLGDAALARGDVATARAQWTRLMTSLEPSDPRRAELETRLVQAGATR